MLTHDALSTYVADRQQARMDAASASRTGRLLRRARAAVGAAPAPIASSPVVPAATAGATGPTEVPDVAVLRTAATTGAPEAA